MKKLLLLLLVPLVILAQDAPKEQPLSNEQLNDIQFQSCTQARDADANIFRVTIEKQKRQIESLKAELSNLKGEK